MQSLGKPEAAAGWHFLTSSRPERARRPSATPSASATSSTPKGRTTCTRRRSTSARPSGRVARTIQGIKFDSEMLQDSLIEASAGKISSGLFGVAR